jgi:WD40 repeat protein
VFGLVFHPYDSNILLSAGWDDTVQFWDTRQPHSVRKLSGPHVCGDALHIEPSSLNIVTGSWRYQDSLQIWDFVSGKLLSTLQSTMESKCYAACWVTKGMILAGGSQKHVAVLLDSKNDEVQCTF